VLTCDQFYDKLRENRIPVTRVTSWAGGLFEVTVEPRMTAERFGVMLEDISEMPEVLSAVRPDPKGRPGVLHIVPSWLTLVSP